MRRFIACLVLVLFCTNEVLAWGVAGHRIVASIAFRQLSVPQREKVIGVLKEHPRFEQDFKERMPPYIESAGPASQNEWLFQQAALWPDLARDFHGSLKDKYHRPNWHFINRPIFLSDADRMALEDGLSVNLSVDPTTLADGNQNVVQVIKLARQIIKDPAAAPKDKGLMLAWLFHTVGDLHQPAHSSALFSRNLFPRGDRGGNLVSTEQQGSLHSVWDRFPGASISYFKARNEAFDLIDSHRQHGEGAAGELREDRWLDESFELAKSDVYSLDVLSHLRVYEMDNEHELLPLDLADGYLRSGGRHCDKRMIAAGYRLAAVLKQLIE
jgi:hypothetical protein